jgi:hypothetical protein
MRTKDQLKQVVERALYEPNSKAFLKREMQIAKEKYYYEHEDFLNDSLMNISEIASSETFRFNIQRNQIKLRLSKEEFIRDYYRFCIDKEGLTFEEYFEREEPKVKQKVKDEITALEKRHKAYINKCNKIDSELKELKKEKQMDLSQLDNIFNPKRMDDKKLNELKDDLKACVPTYDKMQIAALASIIYENDILHKNTKPKFFNDWLKQFCNILGVEKSNYKPSSIKIQEKEKMKNTYYYLFE